VKVLIVDDEPGICLVLRHFLEGKGYEVLQAGSLAEAREALAGFAPDLAFLDQVLPDGDGETLIGPLHDAGIMVVVMTAYGDVERAVRCMSKGAEYFFQKPLDIDHVAVIVDRLREKRALRQEADVYRRLCERGDHADTLVGSSSVMGEVKRLIGRLSQNTATPVLILGESGTGKELVAREVHALSGAKGPFVDLNCASLNENLLESELFGHEKGAFTDARQAKRGLFEIAEGGSLFFDELTEMPLSVQAKLLRVLDSGAFRRVGGVREVRSDARVMAATNRDPERAVAEGRFREDLFYRLSVFPVRIPPLRERPEDVGVLAQYFLTSLGERLGKPRIGLSGAALAKLREYPWPGNVRELRNVIERALILCDGAELEPSHLPAEIRNGATLRPRARIVSMRPLEEMVQEHIVRVVQAAGGNHSQAARILGISRSTLLARLKKGREAAEG